MVSANRTVSVREDSGCGRVYVVTEFDSEGTVTRIQLESGKGGTCIKTMLGTISKLANLALSNGAHVEEIVSILNNQYCHRMRSHIGNITYSCLDASAKAICSALNEQGNMSRNEDTE